jgi:hypothetical protein
MTKNNNRLDRIEKMLEALSKSAVEFRKGIKELEESQKKTDEQIKKTHKEIDKLLKAVTSISSGYGRFVEGIISPSAVKYFYDTGYKIEKVHHRIQIYKDGKVFAEYDTIIETKFNKKKYIFVGEAITYERDVESNAIKKGFYVFRVTDNIMKPQVPEGFIPGEF